MPVHPALCHSAVATGSNAGCLLWFRPSSPVPTVLFQTDTYINNPSAGLCRRACGHFGSKDGTGLPRDMTRWCSTRSARVGWEEGISWTREERGGMNSKTLASESRVPPSPVTLVLMLSADLYKVSDLGLGWLSACHQLGGCSSIPLRRQSGWCSER